MQKIPSNALRIEVERTRLDFDEYVCSILSSIQEKLQKESKNASDDVF